MFPNLLLWIHGERRQDGCSWDDFEKKDFLRVRCKRQTSLWAKKDDVGDDSL